MALPAHEGDHDRAALPAVEVVPSAAGVRALRCMGKGSLVAAWTRHLAEAHPAVVRPVTWRLVEEVAGGDPAAVRPDGTPRTPAISEVNCDDAARSLACRMHIPYELEVFAGHFPTVPVVPGVLQIGWAIALARQHLHVTDRFKGIGTAKFRRLVQPGMLLDLRLQYARDAGQLRFEYSLRQASVSLGRLLFGAAHE